MEKFLLKSPATPKGCARAPGTPIGSSPDTPAGPAPSPVTPKGAGSCSGSDPYKSPSVQSSNRAEFPQTPVMKKNHPRFKVRDSTPRSHNSRTAWTPIYIKMGGSIQIHILCQRSNGYLGPYTSAGSASKKRPLWEPIRDCEFVIEKNEEVTKRYFVFTNTDNEVAKFRADLFNPLLVRTNPFSQKCASLLVGNPKLLAVYLSVISSSAKFCNFDEETHEVSGFRKDGGGWSKTSVVGLGGTLEDYQAFVKMAFENTEEVGGGDETSLKVTPASRKRKVTDYFNKVEDKKKMSKAEQVEDRYREMLAEDGGLEKSLASSYVKFQVIPLEKLAVSPDLFLPINKNKVNEIAESIDDRKDAIC